MAPIFLALFLIVFGLNLLLGLSIPIWVSGLLAVVAGILILMKRFSISLGERSAGRTAGGSQAKGVGEIRKADISTD